MWVVIKYNLKEFETLKDSFRKVIGEMPEFYSPKYKYQKFINNKLKQFETKILSNYLICRHEKFSDPHVISLLKNTRGLNYFLKGSEFNQKAIIKFINFCKSQEDSSGYLTQGFFNLFEKTNAKFISGPFTEMMFDIIEQKGKKLKILLNNINMTISKDSSNYLYC
tara:strand:- start:210 stop:707 length:498 start_codon:yes stop_codon:yes gene_type:complete